MPAHCNTPLRASTLTENVLKRLGRGLLAAVLTVTLMPVSAFASSETTTEPPITPIEEPVVTPDAATSEPVPAPVVGAQDTPTPPTAPTVDNVVPQQGLKDLTVTILTPASLVEASFNLRSVDTEVVFAKQTLASNSPIKIKADLVVAGSYYPALDLSPEDGKLYELADTYQVVINGVSAMHNKGDPVSVADGDEVSVVLSLVAMPVTAEPSVAEPTDTAAIADEPVAPASPRVARSVTRAVVEPDYSGSCYITCLNPGPTSDHYNLFAVTMPDGQILTAHCIDPGQAAPADGWYAFTGAWNGSVYDITVHSGDADPNPGSVAPLPTQRIGNFQWLPHGYHDPGWVEVQKYDQETGLTTGQNGLTFAGAQFELRNTGSGQTWTITLNNFGWCGIRNIPLGDYTLVETVAPVGYDLDPTVHSISIGTPNSGNNSASIKAYDAIQKGEIAIQKSTVGGTSNLSGIKFDVINAATDQVATTITLDGTGRGATGKVLPYGHYRIVEDATSIPADLMAAGFSGHEGDVVVSDAFVAGKDTYTYDVVNYKKISLDLIKLDGDAVYGENPDLLVDPSTIDPAAIARVTGAVYTLSRQEGGTWMEIGAATTNTAGIAKFAAGAIDRFGTYKIEETLPADVNSPDGYMWPVESRQAASATFVVDATTYNKVAGKTRENIGDMGFGWGDNGHGSPLLKLTAINWKYRSIKASKVDSETGEGVSDALFTLERWTGSGKPVEAGGTDASGTWTEVSRKDSDTSGDALFEGLVFGWYRLTELSWNPAYQSPGESGLVDTFFIECSATSGVNQVQVVENAPLTVETTVDKSTIKQTSVGHVYTDENGKEVSNVGNEQYRYDVSFTNGNTNVFADEYWIEDQCQMTQSPWDLRIKSIVTPVVSGDTDGRLHVLYKTNKGGGSAAGMSFTQPELHADDTLCDGTSRFDCSGWNYLGEYSATSPAVIKTDSFLGEGEYITEISLQFGAVEVGFASLTPMTYLVEASHELVEGAVIPNTATSHITRNWSKVQHTAHGDIPKEPSGPHDDAVDSVQTTVVSTFNVSFDRNLKNWSGGSRNFLSQTGDPIALVVSMIVVALVSALAVLAVVAHRRWRASTDL